MWTLHAVGRRAWAKQVMDDEDVKYGPPTSENSFSHSGSSSMSAIVQCSTGLHVWLKVISWPGEEPPENDVLFMGVYTSFIGFKVFDSEPLGLSFNSHESESKAMLSAVMAEVKSNTSYLEHETMIYDDILLDLGNDYDVQTGIYVCPQDGLYVFILSGQKWKKWK